MMAILRTVWRMLFSRKNLLEWNLSSASDNFKQGSLPASYSMMWIEPFLALAAFNYLGIYYPEKLLIAGPILFFWFIIPAITWSISKLMAKQVSVLTKEQNIFLRNCPRRI